MTDNNSGEMLQNRLWEAAARGDCATIRQLALCGVDIDARNEEGFTAFNLATQNNRPEAALTILAAKEVQYMQQLGVEPEDYLRQKEAVAEMAAQRRKAS